MTCVFSLTPTPPANAFVTRDKLDSVQGTLPLDVYFCDVCSHLQLLDVVNPEITFRDYVYVSGTSPAFVNHFQTYADDCIARFTPPLGGLAVDIGSNDGSLLQFFKLAGLNVLGVDPAEKIATAATARGLETWPHFLTSELAERIISERGQASLVTANNVFAHVDDLGTLTDAIQAILAPDGVFIFEVSYAADVHSNLLFDTIYHEHLDYHTVGPLVPFFKRHGLELFSVRRVNTHGGSLRGYVQKHGGPHAVDASLDAFIGLERDRGLNGAAAWIEFAQRVDRLSMEFKDLIGGLKAQGSRIAGFGAPAKATTFMYHFGVGNDVIDYIVDDSPLKQGLFTPGKHVPVVSSAEIASSMPDYMVILAWNFADTIIAKNRDYMARGGRFIVPLPEVRIV